MHILESQCASHLDIAITCWARARAREVKDAAAAKAPDLEQFLAELLQDALRTFNRDYMAAYNQHVKHLEVIVRELNNFSVTPPTMLRKDVSEPLGRIAELEAENQKLRNDLEVEYKADVEIQAIASKADDENVALKARIAELEGLLGRER